MTIEEFAQQHHLKIKKSSCDEQLIVGKLVKGGGQDRPENHHHIYEVNGRFFAFFNYTTVGKWNNVRKELELLGARAIVNAQTEGVLHFDHTCQPLVKAVFKHVRVKVKRQLTPEQKEAIRARFSKKS